MTTLTVQKRGNEKPAVLRRQGLLPAVVYGRKESSTSIAIPLRDFEKALREAGESTIVTLQGLGDEKDVLIHDIAYDPLSGAPLHADLYAVEKGQKVRVSVPLSFEGVSPAVKDLGGILVKVMHELEIEAEPRNLPHGFSVDISKLATLEDQIHVRDITLPAGVEMQADPDEVVAMIAVAKEEPAEAPAMDITQIETSVERGKKEEEGTAAPEAAKE